MRESFIIPNRDFCQLNLRLLNQRHNNVRLHFVSYVELSKGQRLKCGVCWSRKIRNGWKELMTGGAKSRYWTCRKKITEEGKENPHNSQSNFPFKCCNRTRLLWKDVTLEEEKKKRLGNYFWMRTNDPLNSQLWQLTFPICWHLFLLLARSHEPMIFSIIGGDLSTKNCHKLLARPHVVAFLPENGASGQLPPPKEQQTEKVIGQIENIKPVN